MFARNRQRTVDCALGEPHMQYTGIEMHLLDELRASPDRIETATTAKAMGPVSGRLIPDTRPSKSRRIRVGGCICDRRRCGRACSSLWMGRDAALDLGIRRKPQVAEERVSISVATGGRSMRSACAQDAR